MLIALPTNINSFSNQTSAHDSPAKNRSSEDRVRCQPFSHFSISKITPLKLYSTLALAACLLAGVPSLAAVSIAAPADGTVVSSPVQVNATDPGAHSISVYVNGVLVTRQRHTDSVEASVNLDPGAYTVKVVASDGWGSSSQATSTITVSDGTVTPPVTPDPPPSSPPGMSVASQIAQDMQGQNEGNPHGVPLSYDWAVGPVTVMGNNSDGWKAIESWGALYEAAEGNPATNTRVNIRNMQTYFLQKSSGKWLLLQNTSQPDGAAYVEDFSGDSNRPANVRTEPDGTISATAGGGYNFHFYPSNRASIDPNDIGGIVVVVQARLIVGDPSKPDDTGTARYLLGSGADYYPDLAGGWPGTADFNPGVALGKMKYVQTQWRSFCMTTLTQSQLQNNPPPVNFSGIAP